MTGTKNLDVRKAAADNNVKLWEVSAALGICDTTFSKRLRRELSTEEKAEIMAIIDRLAEEAK